MIWLLLHFNLIPGIPGARRTCRPAPSSSTSCGLDRVLALGQRTDAGIQRQVAVLRREACVSEANHPPGLWPVPGDGVLARHGHLILLSSLESGQFVDVMLDLLEQAAAMGGDGRQFTDQIAGVLESDEAAEMVAADDAQSGPSVLAFGATDMGVSVVVSGNAWADIYDDARHPARRGRPARHAAALHAAGPGDRPPGRARRGRQRCGQHRPVLPAGCWHGAGQRPELLRRRHVGDRPGRRTGSVDGPAAASVAPPPPPVPDSTAGAQPVVTDAPPPPPPPPPTAARAGAASRRRQSPCRMSRWRRRPCRPPPPPPPPFPAPEPSGPPSQQGTEVWQPAAGAVRARAIRGRAAERRRPGRGRPPISACCGASRCPRRGTSRRGPAATSSDAPIVQGVYCSRGHFDDPESLFCAVCGISMNQQTLVPGPVPGRRSACC